MRLHCGDRAQHRVAVAIETQLRQLRLHKREQLLGRLRREVLPVHPLQFCRVEDGRLLQNTIEREEAPKLILAHDLAIAAGTPSKQREKVTHRLWENT